MDSFPSNITIYSAPKFLSRVPRSTPSSSTAFPRGPTRVVPLGTRVENQRTATPQFIKFYAKIFSRDGASKYSGGRARGVDEDSFFLLASLKNENGTFFFRQSVQNGYLG